MNSLHLLQVSPGTWFAKNQLLVFTWAASTRNHSFLLKPVTTLAQFKLQVLQCQASCRSFVASCDYTLIGEEFFAASAYLSGDPLQIGSLKGQDYGKFMSVLILVVGIFFATRSISLRRVKKASRLTRSSYIKNNMLGSEGLGSFGGGDTDIEGDDS